MDAMAMEFVWQQQVHVHVLRDMALLQILLIIGLQIALLGLVLPIKHGLMFHTIRKLHIKSRNAQMLELVTGQLEIVNVSLVLRVLLAPDQNVQTIVQAMEYASV